MTPIFVIYAGIAISGVVIYGYNITRLSRQKKIIGEVHAAWSLKFNIKNRINWIIWAVVIAYLLMSFYFVISNPRKDNNYFFLVFFMTFLSFHPTWSIRVGSKGIILGQKIISNEKIVEKKIIVKGKKKYLLLKWAPDSLSPRIKTTLIHIPLKNINQIPT